MTKQLPAVVSNFTRKTSGVFVAPERQRKQEANDKLDHAIQSSLSCRVDKFARFGATAGHGIENKRGIIV